MGMKEPKHEPIAPIPGVVSNASDRAAHAEIPNTVSCSKEANEPILPNTVLKK